MLAPPHAHYGAVSDSDAPFRFRRLLVQAGLEGFFVGIGRPERPGEPDPAPYPRSTEAGAIEPATVFEVPDAPPEPPWDTAPVADPSVLGAPRREADGPPSRL